MCLTSPVMIVFSVLVWAPLTAFSQAPGPKETDENALKVISKARETYQNLRSYQLERTTSIFEAREGEEPKQVAELKLISATADAERPPEWEGVLPFGGNQFRFSLETGGNKFVWVSHEDAEWYYSSRENVYKKGTGKGLGVLGSVAGPVLLSIHAFPFTTLEDGSLEEAKIVREESIEVEKQTRKCYVIEAQATSMDIAALAAKAQAAIEEGKAIEAPAKPKFLGAEFLLTMLQMQGYLGDGKQMAFYRFKGKPTKVTLWIDPSQHLLVKSEMEVTLQKSTVTKEKPAGPKDEEVNVTLTESFTRLKINEDLPKKLFEFMPPAGAKEFEAGSTKDATPSSAAPKSLPDAGSSSDEATALIEKTRDTYRNLRSYQFERTTAFVESGNGKEPKQVSSLQFITASEDAKPFEAESMVLPLNPDRFLLSVMSGGNKFILINNDEEGRTEGWWYWPQMTIHKRGKGILASGAVSGSTVLRLHAFPFALFEKGVVQNARIVGEETIEIEGEKRLCSVIEGRMKATYLEEFKPKLLAAIKSAVLGGELSVRPEGPRVLGIDGMQIVLNAQRILDDGFGYEAKAKETNVKLWIDSSQHLLAKAVLSSTLRKLWIDKDKPFEQQEVEVQVTLTDSFNRLRINEELPSKLFRFRPPAGGKEILEAR
jgi:hypothetical protein